MKTEILDFPSEEAEERAAFISGLMPALGEELLRFQPDCSIHNAGDVKADRILMNQADAFLQTKITDAIRLHYPEDTIISEEHYTDDRQGDFTWWLDPVDGTRNFIHGVPLFVISAGISWKGDPAAGVVYAPVFKELYKGVKGCGAFKNGNPIQVSSLDEPARLLVSAGLPFRRREILKEIMTDLSAFIRSGSGLRRTGSLILDLCWIAEGRFDALWERDTEAWDTCGASVILTEAGGRMTGFSGDDYTLKTRDILASNAGVHPDLIRILQSSQNAEGMN